jgi:hypothetical protein
MVVFRVSSAKAITRAWAVGVLPCAPRWPAGSGKGLSSVILREGLSGRPCCRRGETGSRGGKRAGFGALPSEAGGWTMS